MATIRDDDLLYIQRGEVPYKWTGVELKALVSGTAGDGSLIVGQYLTPNAQEYDGSSDLTINVDAVSAATANKVVVRDNAGSFAGNVVTVTTLSGVNAFLSSKVEVGGSFGAGNITLRSNGTGTFSGAVSASSFSGTLSGGDITADSIPNSALDNSTISGKELGTSLSTLTRGSYLTGSNYDGSTARTWAVDATSANTASKVVARDSSGNFSAGTITAALSGTASYASNSDKVDGYNATTAGTGSTCAVRDGSGDIGTRLFRSTYANQSTISGGMCYRINNSSDNYIRTCSDTGAIRTFLSVPTRTGGNASGTWGISITGNAATASSTSGNSGSSTNSRVDHDTGNAWHRPVFITDGQGSATNQRLYTDSASTIGINPSSNQVRATTFVGALSGNASTASNADKLDGYNSSTSATGSTVAVRDGSGHLTVNYLFSSYCNMSHGTATRNSDTIFYSSTDNYIRKSNASGMRSSLNVPTRTGGSASGTWGINITGNAATVTINTSDANSSYYMLWHSGNTVYKTNGIYCNPSSDTVFAKNFNCSSTMTTSTIDADKYAIQNLPTLP